MSVWSLLSKPSSHKFQQIINAQVFNLRALEMPTRDSGLWQELGEEEAGVQESQGPYQTGGSGSPGKAALISQKEARHILAKAPLSPRTTCRFFSWKVLLCDCWQSNTECLNNTWMGETNLKKLPKTKVNHKFLELQIDPENISQIGHFLSNCLFYRP